MDPDNQPWPKNTVSSLEAGLSHLGLAKKMDLPSQHHAGSHQDGVQEVEENWLVLHRLDPVGWRSQAGEHTGNNRANVHNALSISRPVSQGARKARLRPSNGDNGWAVVRLRTYRFARRECLRREQARQGGEQVGLSDDP